MEVSCLSAMTILLTIVVSRVTPTTTNSHQLTGNLLSLLSGWFYASIAAQSLSQAKAGFWLDILRGNSNLRFVLTSCLRPYLQGKLLGLAWGSGGSRRNVGAFVRRIGCRLGTDKVLLWRILDESWAIIERVCSIWIWQILVFFCRHANYVPIKI